MNEKNVRHKQKTNHEMTDLNPNTPVIKLNINGLSVSIKNQMIRLDILKRPNYTASRKPTLNIMM